MNSVRLSIKSMWFYIVFNENHDAHLDMLSLGERDAFVQGFTLGVKLMVAVMNQEK